MSKSKLIVEKDGAGLVPSNFFEGLPYWKDLKKEEQNTVVSATLSLRQNALKAVEGRLGMGLSLLQLQAVLEGRGLFVKYLHTLNFSYRTAYRLMVAASRVEEGLPRPALEAAVARGIDLISHNPARPFGAYTEPIKQLPPPPGVAGVDEWLDKLEKLREDTPGLRPKRIRTTDTTKMELRAFRAVRNAYRALSVPPKAKHAWAVSLIGKIMAELGVPAQRFEPEAAPDEFRRGPGFPLGKKRGPRPHRHVGR
jgi:hypothetical protein